MNNKRAPFLTPELFDTLAKAIWEDIETHLYSSYKATLGNSTERDYHAGAAAALNHVLIKLNSSGRKCGYEAF